MFERISEEIVVKVAANEAWKVYGTLRLANLAVQGLPGLIQKVDVLEGDGGAGTVLKLDLPGFGCCKEKFKVVDDEKRVKVAQIIEGGYLNLGFTSFGVRIEVIDNKKDENSCTIKFTVEYEVKGGVLANASFFSIAPYIAIMNIGADYLTKNNKNNK